MRRILLAATVLVLAVALPAGAVGGGSPIPPKSFFGIAPQTELTGTDAAYMRAGRIGTVRWPLPWSGVQPTADGGYEWGGFDEVVATAARRNLRVLPFVYSTPAWAGPAYTTLPVDSAGQREAWAAFLRAAVERYGPGGTYWREHAEGSADYVPEVPLREWQIWNEANFFYFAFPASPLRYAKLLQVSNRAIDEVDPGVKVLLSGLFAEPSAARPSAMHAVDFLKQLYRVPGIKASFDGVALHPYAEDAQTLARMTEELRQVMLDNGDRRTGLYITEVGWGSQHNPNVVSFENGVGSQLRQMRTAYRYLIDNRLRLNLKSVYWFTWKDVDGSCNFCDSTGFFSRGDGMRAKSAWRAFVGISGGRARP